MENLVWGKGHVHVNLGKNGMISTQVGYVMQPGAAAAGGSAYGADRGYGRGRGGGGGSYGGGGPRFRPY